MCAGGARRRRGGRCPVEWVWRGVRVAVHRGRRYEPLRASGLALRERRRVLLGPVRSPGGVLRRRGAHQLRGRRRSVHDVARVLLALVRGRAVFDANLRIRRARMRVRRRLLQRDVLRRRVQGAQQRVQDVGQRVRTELRVLLAALLVGSLLDGIVVLHPERRHVRARPRLLRGRVHDGRRRVGGYLQRTARRGDVLQRRRRRDGVQDVRRLLQSSLRSVWHLRSERFANRPKAAASTATCARRTRTAAVRRAAVFPATAMFVCDIQAGFAVGICRNPTGCNPEGNVCHYKDYACANSSARNDCCGAPGNSGACQLDKLGVPRCHGVGACVNAGGACAFDDDCCTGGHCVPGPTASSPASPVAALRQCVHGERGLLRGASVHRGPGFDERRLRNPRHRPFVSTPSRRPQCAPSTGRRARVMATVAAASPARSSAGRLARERRGAPA